MKIVKYFALTILIINSTKSYPEILTSLVYKNNFEFIQNEVANTNYSFSLLFNRKNELLFCFSLEDKIAKVLTGDIWINFGRGTILGDTKYHYFTKYIYTFKYYTNGIKTFNYYLQDKNFDNVQDIRKGIGITFSLPLTLHVFFLTQSNAISNLLFGAIIEKNGLGILISKYKNNFLSLNYKSENLLNLGIVSDIELSAIITSNILLGISFFIEWYYRKFEFSLEARTLSEHFNSEFSSPLFSRNYPKNVILTSLRLNEDNTKISYINKINIPENEIIENEFYLSVIQKIFKNTFLNAEIIRDYQQNATFCSVYPFLSIDKISLFSKPIFRIDYSNLERIETGFSINILNFKAKIILVLPLIQNDTYNFLSSEVRDNFGENIDVKISNLSGIAGIVSILYKSENLKAEIITHISEKDNFKFFLVFSSKIEQQN